MLFPGPVPFVLLPLVLSHSTAAAAAAGTATAAAAGMMAPDDVHVRYAKFLLLRKHHLELGHPIPPMDVSLIWSSHMSCSGLYGL